MYRGRQHNQGANRPISAYTVFFDPDNNNVLVATKKNHSNFFGRNFDRRAPIVNNPGQIVFPGGRADVVPGEQYQRGNFFPDLEHDALQELAEETGFRADIPNRTIHGPEGFMFQEFPGVPAEPFTAPMLGLNQLAAGDLRERQPTHGGMYLPVATPHLQRIARAYEQIHNADMATLARQDRHPNMLYRHDDELASMHMMPLQGVVEEFNIPGINPHRGPGAPNARMQRDWFGNLANHLQQGIIDVRDRQGPNVPPPQIPPQIYDQEPRFPFMPIQEYQ